jgi:beta-xylosidase
MQDIKLEKIKNKLALSIYKLSPELLNWLERKRFFKRYLPDLIKNPQWSIGIYVGQSPLKFMAAKNVKNPVLECHDVSDVTAELVADPFMVKVEQTWYMFFEIYNQQTRKGEIGLAVSQDAVKWDYQQIVLAEKFHLSYPYVFVWMNEYYMIPETGEAKSIRLYKASKFPTHWTFVDNLVSGSVFLDPSIFRYDNRWWLFVETNPHAKYDTLRLYYADELTGPWIEHPKSPIINGNPHIARPAGRVVVMHDRIIRYTQDCYPFYGMQVRAFEITELTPTNYQEKEVEGASVLTPSPTGFGWNGGGMHHIDPHLNEDGTWIACVDGWV